MLVLMLAGVVHGVDLRHAAGQVAQEPRPDLGVDALAGGQKPRHFIHAFAESGAVFPQNRGVCVQRGCGAGERDICSFKIRLESGSRFVDYLKRTEKEREREKEISSSAHPSSEPSGGSGGV